MDPPKYHKQTYAWDYLDTGLIKFLFEKYGLDGILRNDEVIIFSPYEKRLRFINQKIMKITEENDEEDYEDDEELGNIYYDPKDINPKLKEQLYEIPEFKNVLTELKCIAFKKELSKQFIRSKDLINFMVIDNPDKKITELLLHICKKQNKCTVQIKQYNDLPKDIKKLIQLPVVIVSIYNKDLVYVSSYKQLLQILKKIYY